MRCCRSNFETTFDECSYLLMIRSAKVKWFGSICGANNEKGLQSLRSCTFEPNKFKELGGVHNANYNCSDTIIVRSLD